MKLKPSILRDYKDGAGVEVEEQLENYCHEEDILIFEDSSGRIPMKPTGTLLVDDCVTGTLIALLGTSKDGEFIVDEFCWAGMAPQMPLPAAAGEDKFVALVSGLSLGAEGDGASNALSLQMMIDYLAGHLGGSQDLAHAAAVVRVIVAGNSIEKRAATEESRKKGSATDITQGAQDLDLALLQLCAAVPVDMMPGETDPSQFMMPQQPLHR